MNNARLVTLEGDNFTNQKPVKLRQYLAARMDKNDFESFMGSDGITEAHIDYLDNKYPDLMGIWPVIAKVLGKVGTLIGRGVKAAKAAKAKRQANALAQQQRTYGQATVSAISQAESEEKKKKTTLLIAGVVGVGALVFMMSKKK